MTQEVTISAIGGPTVQVEEGQLANLVEEAGVELEFDLTREGFGQLVDAAKKSGRQGMLGTLLTVRDELAPRYRVRNKEGKGWRPTSPAQHK